jgi:Do/DeqQ family serine protease
MIRPPLIFVLLAALPVAASAADPRAAPSSAQQVQLSYAPVVRRAAPAVVNVYTRAASDVGASAAVRRDPAYRRFFAPGEDRLGHSLGSGVIVDPNGTIVTNQHVIQDAGSIVVVLSDRREFDAELVRSDDRTDLAVLKINPGAEALPFLPLKDTDDLEVGDIVLAIGNPFGVGQTVTSGIVSALGRSVDGINDYRSFIQTDAAINPGNSGGALVSLDGKLAGINTALYSEGGGSVGIGFAIPGDLVRSVLAPSEGAGHRIMRPWLGATGRSVTAGGARKLGLSHPSGMLIDDVVPQGPAAIAGVRSGDVILSIDEKPVADEDGLRFRFATLPVGATAKLGIWRAGEPMDLDIRLLAPPEVPPRSRPAAAGRRWPRWSARIICWRPTARSAGWWRAIDAVLDDPVGAARLRQDHDRPAAGRGQPTCIRAAVGGVLRRGRPAQGVRGAAPPRAGGGTLLFVDEIHRFNRAQQDGFLPYVEDGTVVLIGATTENPSFELNGALLSRCQVLVLKRLDEAALETCSTRAEAARAGALPLDPDGAPPRCAPWPTATAAIC